MLASQVGRHTPDTLPSPDPSMGSLRPVLVSRGAPASFLNQGNMDICILVLCYSSQPLLLGRVSRFGPIITGPGSEGGG
jgi:hypothetical protein